MTADWMSAGIVENDAEESRSARIHAERCGDMTHEPDCHCGARSCIADRMVPEDWRDRGSALVSMVLFACIVGGLALLGWIGGTKAMCAMHDQSISYCEGYEARP